MKLYELEVKVNFTLEMFTKAKRERSIAVFFLKPGRWMGWAVSTTLLPLYPREVPCGRLGGTGAGLDECENFASTGIRSPDRPTFSESVYRLSYAGPKSCGE